MIQNVVIIGAGPAGLAALFVASKYHVEIYERRPDPA